MQKQLNAFAAEGGVMQISYHMLDINSPFLRASWPQDDQQGWTISFIFKVGTQRMCANEIRTLLDWCKVNSLQVQPETDRLYRYARLPPSSMWWDPDHVPVIGNKQTKNISAWAWHYRCIQNIKKQRNVSLTFSKEPMSGLCHVSILIMKSSFMYSFWGEDTVMFTFMKCGFITNSSMSSL